MQTQKPQRIEPLVRRSLLDAPHHTNDTPAAQSRAPPPHNNLVAKGNHGLPNPNLRGKCILVAVDRIELSTYGL